jgi:hypothetical protein
MHDRIAARERLTQRLTVSDGAFYKLRTGIDCLEMTSLESVQYDTLVTSIEQYTRRDRADVAGAASDEYAHQDSSGSFPLPQLYPSRFCDMLTTYQQLPRALRAAPGRGAFL